MLEKGYCEVCGNSDLSVDTGKTEYGEFTRCSICLRVGAGIPGDPRFVKNTTRYDKETDQYIRDGKVVTLRERHTANRTVLKTRKDMIGSITAIAAEKGRKWPNVK